MMWAVDFDRGTAFVTGPKAEARRRIAACGDPAPVYVRRREAWATSPAVASRVLDQLEARNLSPRVEHADQSALDLTETEPANVPAAAKPRPAREEGLW